MIIPTKHTNFSESLLGLGSYILNELKTHRTVDYLWKQYNIDYKKKRYFGKHNFDNLLRAIVFLHSIGAVEEKEGEVIKCG